MHDPHSRGDQGETIAANFLKQNGYIIQERNFRYGRYEIDIIAKYEAVLVFIEVKTRRSNYFGYADEQITSSKMQRITDAAEEYMLKHDHLGACRFDIIAVYLEPSIQIEHFTDAYLPGVDR